MGLEAIQQALEQRDAQHKQDMLTLTKTFEGKLSKTQIGRAMQKKKPSSTHRTQSCTSGSSTRLKGKTERLAFCPTGSPKSQSLRF
jgi:hypothetical protein